MAEIEKILRLVEQGILSPEEAEEILNALERQAGAEATSDTDAGRPRPSAGRARHLRIEITESGRQVVNLRVPVNIASFAAGIVPGLPDEEAERIRSSLRSGVRETLLDIADRDGDRVLIVTE